MKLDIQSIHFDADQKLSAHIIQKTEKLDRYFDKIVSAEVFLKLEKSENRDNKVVEIKLEVPGNELFACKKATSFEEALDETLAALITQIKKFKQNYLGIKKS